MIQEHVPHFTCPRCGKISYYPVDLENGYCANCRDFTGGDIDRNQMTIGETWTTDQ